MKRILYLFFVGFLTLSISSCSSDDDTPSDPSAGGNSKEDPKDDKGGNENKGGDNTTASFFEGIVKLEDEGEEFDFKATGENVAGWLGDFELDEGTIPDALFLAFKDDDSSQQLSLLGASITEEGTYIMGEDGFDLASLFSLYQKDIDDDSVENLYTFHDYSIELEGETYQTEFTIEVTGLSKDRIQGNLRIVMYSSVLEYEGVGDDKKLVDGFIHKGTVEGEFDIALADGDLDLNS